jgi:hypothetical protein
VRGRGVGLLTTAIVVGCVTTGCAQPGVTRQGPMTANPAQSCVQAVFDVLSNMVSRPYDNRPFEDFVTRYGPGTAPYDAYLDIFTSFYSLSSSAGVRGAEDRLRPVITKDCTTAS